MAVASQWNSTVDDAQVACLTIATSSHMGVVQSSAIRVWAGARTCGAILPKGHQRVPLLLSKGVQHNRQAVRLEQLAHSDFLPFLNHKFLQHRGTQRRVQIHFRYGSTGRGRCDRHNRQRRHAPGAWSLLPPQGCGHQSAGHRGVDGWGEARLPGLPLGAPSDWLSLGAGVATGATAAGCLNRMACVRGDRSRARCPKIR